MKKTGAVPPLPEVLLDGLIREQRRRSKEEARKE